MAVLRAPRPTSRGLLPPFTTRRSSQRFRPRLRRGICRSRLRIEFQVRDHHRYAVQYHAVRATLSQIAVCRIRTRRVIELIHRHGPARSRFAWHSTMRHRILRVPSLIPLDPILNQNGPIGPAPRRSTVARVMVRPGSQRFRQQRRRLRQRPRPTRNRDRRAVRPRRSLAGARACRVRGRLPRHAGRDAGRHGLRLGAGEGRLPGL